MSWSAWRRTFEKGHRVPFERRGQGAHHEVGGDLCIHHQRHALHVQPSPETGSELEPVRRRACDIKCRNSSSLSHDTTTVCPGCFPCPKHQLLRCQGPAGAPVACARAAQAAWLDTCPLLCVLDTAMHAGCAMLPHV